MKIGDKVLVKGIVDELRKDVVIIRNEGGYFGTVLGEIIDKYAEQEPKILNTLDFAIDASNGDTNYFVGFRNGLRYAKSLVDGEEPQYESCAEQEPCCKVEKDENGYAHVSPKEPCEDAVSRQVVEEMIKAEMPERGMWEIEGDKEKETVCEVCVDLMQKLSDLPSVTPKPIEREDAVSREAVLNTEYQVKIINDIEYVMLSEVQMKIRKMPSVQPKAKTGRWIDHKEDRWIYAKCSECGTVHDTRTNYCPNCGCRMVEPQESESDA